MRGISRRLRFRVRLPPPRALGRGSGLARAVARCAIAASRVRARGARRNRRDANRAAARRVVATTNARNDPRTHRSIAMIRVEDLRYTYPDATARALDGVT